MAKELRSVIVSTGFVQAEFIATAYGATKTVTQSSGWSSTVTAAAAALLAVAQAGADDGDLGYVAQVQVYTPLADRQGSPGFSAPGEFLDITFQQGNAPPSVRVGDDEVVPEDLAAARDALKAAVAAEI